ncbi:NAD(P)-dependent oxidoreductase [Phaeobacter sp. 11ANDIMAR09]|uniref:NAD(P)-dependent oxidoreductase n=1 Tax=Phaeobacter sp. 11ANDIMAR09 TaxID=1225647 RepID=UPI0006C83F31|nr:NAD(P)-dependent oxidoreductase [Phaeobacter sp. 11ANDIMAR09]KPD11537.1 2-hydroxymethylglutarate dehydrogenase [Phaeobacter sp. 11ANDIMAR09]
MRFGFVGLGQMGAPMAANLASSNNVMVFDLSEEAMDAAAEAGATKAGSTADFSGVDVLITCLPSGGIVEKSLFNPEHGIAQRLSADTIVIDTSTIEYGLTLSIGERLSALGLRFLDAPVSGMWKRAQEGTLTMMIGGDGEIVEALRPALATMSNRILHTGAVGSGQLTKLINQLLFDINVAALAEILPMAKKLGLDPENTAEVVNSGTGRSYASEYFIPQILEGKFDTGYPLQAAYKDLISGAEISARYQIPAPVLAAATTTYQQALLEGHGAKDKGAMVLVYERLLGIDCRKEG